MACFCRKKKKKKKKRKKNMWILPLTYSYDILAILSFMLLNCWIISAVKIQTKLEGWVYS